MGFQRSAELLPKAALDEHAIVATMGKTPHGICMSFLAL